MKIDSINALIIKDLLGDSRKSFTEIAKKVGITSTAVRNRYLNLKKLGIIVGSTILVNPRALGYNCFGFLGIKADQKKINEVKDFLINQQGIILTWDKIQEINLGNYFALHSLEDFSELAEKLRKNPHIREIQPMIYLGSPFTQHPDKLIIKSTKEMNKNDLIKKKTSNIDNFNQDINKKKNEKTPELQKLDKTDLEIMRILSKNSRSSFNGIAKKLSVSTVQVINRYEKLKESNIIINSSIVIDPQKIGYTANAMLYISLEIGADTNKVFDRIRSMLNVIILVGVIGDCNIFCTIAIRDFQELFEAEKQIRSTKGIKKVKININPPFFIWPMNFFAPII